MRQYAFFILALILIPPTLPRHRKLQLALRLEQNDVLFLSLEALF